MNVGEKMCTRTCLGRRVSLSVGAYMGRSETRPMSIPVYAPQCAR